jgi:hypothetical protein
MTDAGASKSLEQAVRSLLVAADQCCPAIIGQAHLLYHARSGMMPDSVARALRQLRRDAAGLLEAIADVEEVMQARANVRSEIDLRPLITTPRRSGGPISSP